MISSAHADVFENMHSIRDLYQIKKATLSAASLLNKNNQKIRIAILDKAWFDVKKQIGISLPKSTRFHAGAVAAPDDLKLDHGVKMAQIVTEFLGADFSEQYVEFELYQVFGFTNFKAAIDDLIANPVDLVLYSEVWEFGGNFDGQGFINKEISRATRAGAIWINASGNFGDRTWNQSIQSDKNNWVQLPDQNKSWKIICQAPTNNTCSVRIVLSWNDFKNNSELGTNKDLDLALTDDLLNIIQTSTLKQTADINESRPGYSKYPREIVTSELKPGTYFVRVKNVSQNFKSSDRLRLTADGDFISVSTIDPSESVLNPADNASVIAVGALDSARTSQSNKNSKPDLWTISSILLKNGSEFRGTSNSAAITAASLALTSKFNRLRGYKLNTNQLLQLSSVPFNWTQGRVSMSELGFSPVNSNCFAIGEWKNAPQKIQMIINLGSLFVQTTDGWKIMTSFDPWILTNIKRQTSADRLIISQDGSITSQNRFSPQLPNQYEIIGRPYEAGPCQVPKAVSGKLLRPF